MSNFVPKIRDMSVKQRKFGWDFVKFILMFLIVYGHFCPSGESWTPVTRIIGLCSIPGFFFVSGYFQSRITTCSDLFNKYRKTLMRIVVPMLSWGVIYVVLSLIQQFLSREISDVYDIIQFLKYSPYYIAGIYWFLTALLFCILIGSMLSWMIYENKLLGLLLTAVCPICFCFVSPLLMEHYHFSFIWFFYVAGMLYKQKGTLLNQKIQIPWYLLFIILFIIVVIGVQFKPQLTFYYTANIIGITPLRFVVYRYVLCLIATISVIYGIFLFYDRYRGLQVVTTFASYGIDTLFIYCSHVLVLLFLYRPFILPYLYHEHAGWFVCIVEHVVGLVASFLIYYLMQKICLYGKQFRWLRMFLMGTK